MGEWRDAINLGLSLSRGIQVRNIQGSYVSAIHAVDQFPSHVLSLLDHTSLGSNSWTKKRDEPHSNRPAAFWKPVRTPLTPSLYSLTTEGHKLVDISLYYPRLMKRWDRHFVPDPPEKEFYPWVINHATLHPSRGFHDGWDGLPRMRAYQHGRPRLDLRPLDNAEQHLEPEPPPVVAPRLRCSARVAAQVAAHQPVLEPPGRPPDQWARGDFGSSSPIQP